MAFNLEPELASEYEEGELAKLPFQSPVFVVAEYSAPDILRRIVLGKLFQVDVWIDDDNHPPMPLAEFEARLVADSSWDWRA
ncbi:hypothetical protein P2318_05670 [Myxococcaceae bacterium GXIMD 01537]